MGYFKGSASASEAFSLICFKSNFQISKTLEKLRENERRPSEGGRERRKGGEVQTQRKRETQIERQRLYHNEAYIALTLISCSACTYEP